LGPIIGTVVGNVVEGIVVKIRTRKKEVWQLAVSLLTALQQWEFSGSWLSGELARTLKSIGRSKGEKPRHDFVEKGIRTAASASGLLELGHNKISESEQNRRVGVRRRQKEKGTTGGKMGRTNQKKKKKHSELEKGRGNRPKNLSFTSLFPAPLANL
jgi:hypothetical protein